MQAVGGEVFVLDGLVDFIQQLGILLLVLGIAQSVSGLYQSGEVE